jgi:hypothetical protein
MVHCDKCEFMRRRAHPPLQVAMFDAQHKSKQHAMQTSGEQAVPGRRTLVDGDASPIAPAPGPIEAALLEAVIAAHRNGGGLTAGSPYGQAVQAVWQACDANLPRQGVLDAYKRSAVAQPLKRATLGRLAAMRGRFEFLIGWMLQGGIRPTATNWENVDGDNLTGTDDTSNNGTLVRKYTGYESRYGLTGHDWCGMFVGYAQRKAGMSKTSDAYTELSSTSRALAWIEAHRESGFGAAGVAMTPEQIFDGSAVPQPGDVVVLEHHVSMVERFDRAARRIDTIDGNIGLVDRIGNPANSASGRSYTSTHGTDGSMRILAVFRPGLEAFGATSDPRAAPSLDNAVGEGLVTEVSRACHQLTDLYGKLGLAGSVSDTASVSQIATQSAP